MAGHGSWASVSRIFETYGRSNLWHVLTCRLRRSGHLCNGLQHISGLCFMHAPTSCSTVSRAWPCEHYSRRHERIKYTDVVVRNVRVRHLGRCAAGNHFILRSLRFVMRSMPTTSAPGLTCPLLTGSITPKSRRRVRLPRQIAWLTCGLLPRHLSRLQLTSPGSDCQDHLCMYLSRRISANNVQQICHAQLYGST